jgi:5-(carboxyamino)imidazole ribonucleotide mutase
MISNKKKESSKAAILKRVKVNPEVAVIMGSKSDWIIMKEATLILKKFNVNFITKIISAHRTPQLMCDFAKNAEKKEIKIIIAGAGGSAHLPGMVASMTILPVLGVPIPTSFNSGLDSLLSIVQMPKGIPVSTFAVGKSGAINAALNAISILALNDALLKKSLTKYREDLSNSVLRMKIT